MSQSLSQMYVHIIFSTKERYPFLKEGVIKQKLYEYIKAIAYQHNCTVIIVGGIKDHVHILTSLHKNISLSKLVEEIKRSSSKWIKSLVVGEEILAKFYWQNGYGAFSVSQSCIEQVKTYIEHQYQHHKKQSFQEEFLKFLIHHQIKYDEKYLWK